MAGFLDARPRVGYFYSGKKTSINLLDSIHNLKVKDFHSGPVVVPNNDGL